MAAPDLTLSDREFRRIQELVRSHAGIELGAHKRQLCQSRLLRRLTALRLPSFGEYLELLADPGSSEHGELINAITTNVTAFFREPHHFDYLGRSVAPTWAPAQRVRLWSAGCSSGEEPWSIAITVHQAMLAGGSRDVKVLATDIDTEVLARAEAGVYTEQAIAPVPAPLRKRYFVRGTGAQAGRWRIADELRALVTFRRLNLFDTWPMQRRFDAIFCRNVIIYFDATRKRDLLTRYAKRLVPSGHLFLGHSESLMQAVGDLVPCGPTTYRRAAG